MLAKVNVILINNMSIASTARDYRSMILAIVEKEHILCNL
jgi:hypothetical protein